MFNMHYSSFIMFSPFFLVITLSDDDDDDSVNEIQTSQNVVQRVILNDDGK